MAKTTKKKSKSKSQEKRKRSKMSDKHIFPKDCICPTCERDVTVEDQEHAEQTETCPFCGHELHPEESKPESKIPAEEVK